MTTDRIEREITINAPIERAWDALTQPESISQWFCNGAPATIDLREGGVMVLDHGEHGTHTTTIVTVDPPRAFSFLWAGAYPGATTTKENSTLVEFTLRSTPDGSILRMVESGFDAVSLPIGRTAASEFESHSGGWTHVMGKYGEYVNGVDAHATNALS